MGVTPLSLTHSLTHGQSRGLTRSGRRRGRSDGRARWRRRRGRRRRRCAVGRCTATATSDVSPRRHPRCAPATPEARWPDDRTRCPTSWPSAAERRLLIVHQQSTQNSHGILMLW